MNSSQSAEWKHRLSSQHPLLLLENIDGEVSDVHGLQEMRHEALKIAGEYNKTVKAKYLDAAVRLRMPYWDWTGDHAGQNGDCLPPSSLASALQLAKF